MTSTPYDIWATAIQAARTRLNDRVETLAADSGKLLDLAQPHVQRMCSNAFRKLQEFLADRKYSGLEQEVTFINVPAVATTDPLIQVKLGYDAYVDGVNPWVVFALPQTLIRPYQLWERLTGTTNILTELDEILNGLPSVPKLNWNRQWEWRDDVLYMPGALVAIDLRMRYGAYFADPADNAPAAATPWYGQIIPILRAMDPLVDYICREVAIAREDTDGAVGFQQSAEAGARLIVGRDSNQAQATQSPAQLGKMRDAYVAKEGEPRTVKR